MIIKLLLIAGIVGVVVYALRGQQSATRQATRRMLGLAFAATAAVSVMYPDILQWLAELVGVTRGTDLLLYGLVVVFLYVSVAQYQRIHLLERRLTTVTRQVALLDVRPPTTGPAGPPASAASAPR